MPNQELTESFRRALIGVSGIKEEITEDKVYFYHYGRLFSTIEKQSVQFIICNECLPEALKRPGATLSQPGGQMQGSGCSLCR